MNHARSLDVGDAQLSSGKPADVPPSHPKLEPLRPLDGPSLWFNWSFRSVARIKSDAFHFSPSPPEALLGATHEIPYLYRS